MKHKQFTKLRDFRAEVNGKRFPMKFKPPSKMKYKGEWCDGLCSDPRDVGKELWIRNDLSGFELLEMLIHEPMHGGIWNLDEETVTRVSLDIASIVWRFLPCIMDDAPE